MEKITDKLLNWASVLDDRTKEQALRTSAMPFVYPHLALMPDAHLGKGATVGSVIPTLRAVMPAAVGVEFRDTEAFLDEIPAAYKDIDQVMADAANLVRIEHTLRQLVNVKGT